MTSFLEKVQHYYVYLDNSRFAGVMALCLIVLLFIGLFTFIKNTWIGVEVKKIANDTLKKEGKYSRTSLTMISAYFISNYFAMYDFIKNGFNFEVFMIYIGLATGVKYLEILDKKNGGSLKVDNSGPNGTSMNVTTKKGVTKKEDNKDSDTEEPVI